MTEAALFDAAPYIVAPPVPETAAAKLSQGRRRTLRQAEAIARGGHPLALVFPSIRVHPDADGRNATRDNAGERPLRCGTCRFRTPIGGHARDYQKCKWPNPDAYLYSELPRVSASAATDIRSWWPACIDHQLGEAP